ncbi:class F sortase [Streptomyces adelaidensis]|uniref:class F sortase n=1 Tax=Streptomyces adelaidensis TaxID=2796465 RepID=UPI001F32F95E|nr:class F sortase [Streptomyces adelaidensis]
MTVALVVGGVHWAQNGERTGADTGGRGTQARGAGAPRAPAPLYFTPPPPDPPSRSASPSTKPTGRAERPERGSPAPTKSARPTPAKPVRPTPTRPAEPPRPAPRRPAGPRTLPPSPAKTLDIRYLGIRAPVMELRLDRQRRLPAPPDDDPKLVGWYAEGPAPGGPGTAVVVGHRDTRTGPAVFAALEMIKPGRIVEVRRTDGRTAVYTVDAVKTYEKARFPDKVVYGPRDRPELRLITCGGAYDRRKGYASNVVVFAHLTATRGPARTT